MQYPNTKKTYACQFMKYEVSTTLLNEQLNNENICQISKMSFYHLIKTLFKLYAAFIIFNWNVQTTVKFEIL